MSTSVYVAFLRGINVGGNALIKMTELKRSFELLALNEVVPVLASGNVVFRTQTGSPATLKRRIEEMFENQFHLPVIALVRSGSQILDLAKLNPFTGIQFTPTTKIHVTLLANESANSKFPKKLYLGEFQVVQVSKGEVFSAVDTSKNAGTPELMKALEKQFGKAITTRTWNTIEKITKVLRPEMPTRD